VGFEAEAAGGNDGDDCCDPNCFAHGVFLLMNLLCRRVRTA
jgi:hypothetical protein